MASSLASFNLRPELLSQLTKLQISSPTPIQELGIPEFVQGNDIIMQAKTGTGKSTLIGIGILNAIDLAIPLPQALVLCPTRELAIQLTAQTKSLGASLPGLRIMAICGGAKLKHQISELEKPCHVIYATPGRILDMISRRALNLTKLKIFTMDEADRLLDMGFHDDVISIRQALPRDLHAVTLSATFSKPLLQLATKIQNNPKKLIIPSQDLSISDYLFVVPENAKINILLKILAKLPDEQGIIFCNQVKTADMVSSALKEKGVSAMPLHRNLMQHSREETIMRFKGKVIQYLVGTDILSRGIDIDALSFIINFDIPLSEESFIHRRGRTGRIGMQGTAVHLMSSRDNKQKQFIDSLKLPIDFIRSNIDKDAHLPLAPQSASPPRQTWVMIEVNGGKLKKISPGHLVGTITAEKSINPDAIGKIFVSAQRSHIAVHQSEAQKITAILNRTSVKGKSLKARIPEFIQQRKED